LSEKILPKDGNEDIPEEISRYYPSLLEAKKIKKPLICYLLDLEDGKQAGEGKRPTLVTKPIKVKYGAKWFKAGTQKYFINYAQIMNFGKHYAYLCKFGNPVGALSFYEYPEDLTDANQVELMTNQHAVEVFKKHKGISQRTVMIIAIVAAIGVIGAVIGAQVALGLNNRIIQLNSQITNLSNENTALKCKIDPTLTICLPPDVETGNGNVMVKPRK